MNNFARASTLALSSLFGINAATDVVIDEARQWAEVSSEAPDATSLESAKTSFWENLATGAKTLAAIGLLGTATIGKPNLEVWLNKNSHDQVVVDVAGDNSQSVQITVIQGTATVVQIPREIMQAGPPDFLTALENNAKNLEDLLQNHDSLRNIVRLVRITSLHFGEQRGQLTAEIGYDAKVDASLSLQEITKIVAQAANELLDEKLEAFSEEIRGGNTNFDNVVYTVIQRQLTAMHIKKAVA